MPELIRLTWNDLILGSKVPWNVYNEDKQLLMSPGQVITQSILDKITKYVLFRDDSRGEYGGVKANTQINAFEKFNELVNRLGGVFEDLVMSNSECVEKIEHIANDIELMVNNEPDASLACVFLPNDHKYSLSHPVQIAILCVMLVGRDCLADDERNNIISAALVANIGMKSIQDNYHDSNAEISGELRKEIQVHPVKSLDVLKKSGLVNKQLLMIVACHHERCDGSGYPRGITGENIPKGALILSVADAFCAMISKREYRKSLSVKEAMVEMFKDQGKLYDSRYELLLIKEISVFPPGSFVKLKSGEIAIITHRGKMTPLEPGLVAVIGRDGTRYATPLLRDSTNNDYAIEGLVAERPKIAINANKIWGYV